jgi:hypothetical protein
MLPAAAPPSSGFTDTARFSSAHWPSGALGSTCPVPDEALGTGVGVELVGGAAEGEAGLAVGVPDEHPARRAMAIRGRVSFSAVFRMSATLRLDSGSEVSARAVSRKVKQ